MNFAFKHRLVSTACLLGLLGAPAWSAVYYVNSASGNNSNPGSSDQPWQTLAKVNSMAFNAGDVVRLATGSVWEGTLQVQNGVTYEAYGSGNKPIITGARSLAGLSWTRLGTSNVYEANVSSITGGQAIGQLVYYNSSGVATRLTPARHPNAGGGNYGGTSRYFKIDSSTPGTNDKLTTKAADIPSGQPVQDALVYVRNDNYILLSYKVDSVTGQTLNLTGLPANNGILYPDFSIRAGWGYWLEGKSWMLDQASEWFYDAPNQKLRVWMPNGLSPASQTLRAAFIDSGIVATNAGNAVIKDIEVRDTRSNAVVIKGSSTANLSGLVVNRAGGRGISVTNSTGGTVNGSLVQDSLADGIWLGDFRYAITQVASNVRVTNNTVNRAGRGYYARSAITGGLGGTISGNLVQGSSYAGILLYKNSIVAQNHVVDSCQEFDDCPGIYAISRGEPGSVDGFALNLDINHNLVVNGPGHPDGRLGSNSSTAGIYLDDFAQTASLSHNFVLGMDYGIQLHYARDIEVAYNTTFKNRKAELWMQENFTPIAFPCNGRPNCDGANYLTGNNIHHNAFASALLEPLIWQLSDYGSTVDFATLSNNRYVISSSPEVVRDELYGNATSYQTLTAWQATGKDSGSTLHRTVMGYEPASTSNFVVESGFNNQGAGWYSYNAVPQIVSTGCQTSPCMSVTGTSNAPTPYGRRNFLINTTGSFTFLPNRQYIVAFDVRTTNTTPGDMVSGVVRLANHPYSDISTRGKVKLDTTWQRVYRIVQSTNATSAQARLDLEFDADGTVFVDNIRLVQALEYGGGDNVIALFNPQTTAQSVSCPTTNTTTCAQYIDVQTGQPIVFPKSVPAKSAIIGFWDQSPWKDDDLDTVPNLMDACPSTPAGRSTDETGCSIAP